MSNHTCSRCEHDLADPIETNANYVVHNDFAEEEEREIHYAWVHTDDTRAHLDRLDEAFDHQRRDSIEAAMVADDAPDTKQAPVDTKKRIERPETVNGVPDEGPLYMEDVSGVSIDDVSYTETVVREEVQFACPKEDFNVVPVDSPQAIHNDEVARIETTVEPVEVQKTGLVCPDCTKDDDTVLWGPADK